MLYAMLIVPGVATVTINPDGQSPDKAAIAARKTAYTGLLRVLYGFSREYGYIVDGLAKVSHIDPPVKWKVVVVSDNGERWYVLEDAAMGLVHMSTGDDAVRAASVTRDLVICLADLLNIRLVPVFDHSVSSYRAGK